MNLKLTPGETGDWLVSLKDAAGNPFPNDTVTQAWFTVKTMGDEPDPGRLQLTIGTGISKVPGTNQLQVVAPHGLTGALADSTQYRWDLRLKCGDTPVVNPVNLSGLLITGRRVTYAN